MSISLFFALLLSLANASAVVKPAQCSYVFLDQSIEVNEAWIYHGKAIHSLQRDLLVSKGIDPEGARYLGGQSEGQVFLLRNNQVVKIFRGEYEYNNAVQADKILARHLTNAGFIVPEIYRKDRKQRLIFMQYIPGKPVDAIFYTHSGDSPLAKPEQYHAFRTLRSMFFSLRVRLGKDKEIIKIENDGNPNPLTEYQGVYQQIPALQLALYTANQRVQINLHAENVLAIVSETGQIYYAVIDFK
jgi:hypothetical protein